MTNAIPTMKTIDETAKYFNLPKYFCRRAVKDGKVAFVKSGSKYLINIESFAQWLNTGDKETEVAEVPEQSKIRRLY